jgi:CubicO group peptidase (beta-lactamase class C family)
VDDTASLKDGLDFLIREKRYITGAVITYGAPGAVETVVAGNSREVLLQGRDYRDAPVPMAADSVFDLASVTKLFTCLCVLMLMERGLLSLDTPVHDAAPRFIHLESVRVRDVLSFGTGLCTDGRIDGCATRAAALECLYGIRPIPVPVEHPYTDMGAMVLKYVIEHISGQNYFDFIRTEILNPLGMCHTYTAPPAGLLPAFVDYNYGRRIINGCFTTDTGAFPGVPHDPKARLLCGGGLDLCGHAGLFSTAGDMALLAVGLLEGRLLSRGALLSIGINRTGMRLPDGRYTQHHGLLCYVKNPDQRQNEVPAGFGEYSFALSGYTGNHFSIDPVHNRFIIILANKIHNRVIKIINTPGADLNDGSAMWEDGAIFPLSSEYVFARDRCLVSPLLSRMGMAG